MERHSIFDSSDIVSVGYDEPSKVLEIEFQGKRVYQYKDVPKEVFNNLMESGDFTDRFFNEKIQYAYEYSRIK